MDAVSTVPACKSFNDVRRNRIRSTSNLRTKFEPLERWKCFKRKGMNTDEEIVGALPGDEIMMSKRHSGARQHSRRVPEFCPTSLTCPGCPPCLPYLPYPPYPPRG